jgi:hypothetical protein
MLLVGAATVVAAPPTNDVRSKARVISSMSQGGSSSVDTTEATYVNELAPSCQGAVGKTVWFRYRPSVYMRVTLDTVGSGFDTVLAVYKSTTTGLARVACNDDIASGNTRSRVQFYATGGSQYYFQVGGYQGQGGALELNHDLIIGHDAFGTPRAITPGFSDQYLNLVATTQANEPSACSSVIKTIWFKFTPKANMVVTFDTLGSTVDTVVAVFRGTSLSNLAFVNCADDSVGSDAVVTWTAQKDRTYYIRVGVYTFANPIVGDVMVNFIRGT